MTVGAELLVIVPSRGRPQNIDRLVTTIRATTKRVDILVCLDDDDAANYPRLPGVEYRVGPRVRFCATVNEASADFTRYPYFAVLGDDVVPETIGWDEKLIAPLRGKPFGISYGADGNWPNGELPTHIVVTSTMQKTLGWLCVPGLIHLCADMGWLDLGNALNALHYCPDVSMQHYHRWGGRAADDATYQEANSTAQAALDHARYQEWRGSPDFTNAVQLLAAL